METSMSKMLKYVSIFFIIVFGWYGIKKGLFLWYVSHYQPPPVTISATSATNKIWHSYLTSVGTLNAINGVELSAEIPGIVEEIRFNSGQFIKKGEIVVVLRTNVEKANLKSNQAQLQLAQINYSREKKLYDKKASSHAVLDKSYAELLRSEASVEASQAAINQKIIIAPFDGKLGIRQINLGQYISPGTPLVTLQSLNPLHVMFTLPEQNLSHIYIGQDIDVLVNFGNGNKKVKGKITAVNAKVDQTTRNILVEATLPNEKFELYPGMYGLVKIWLNEQKDTIVIPDTSISYSLSGNYVFLIKNDPTKKDSVLYVDRQYVKVGEQRGKETSILSGLKAGDRVVTSGQLKLQNGARVVIDNNVEL